MSLEFNDNWLLKLNKNNIWTGLDSNVVTSKDLRDKRIFLIEHSDDKKIYTPKSVVLKIYKDDNR